MEKAASEVNGRTVMLNETRHYSVSEIEVARSVADVVLRWLAIPGLPPEVVKLAHAALDNCGAIIRDGLAEIRARHDKGR